MPGATEDRPSDSPYVERVWRVTDGSAPATNRMLSVANSNWELVVWEQGGRPHVAVRGPETVPSVVTMPEAVTPAFGIVFAHGAVMPHLPVPALVDTAVTAPRVSRSAFTLRGETWELPGYDTAEDFVARLVRAGVLTRDPLVSDVVLGDDPPARPGDRSVQRRVLAATGLTRGTIARIERARHAALLLRAGVRPVDVAHRAGFYDQPHLARSLTRYVGRTATALRHDDAEPPLSLLYKTGG